MTNKANNRILIIDDLESIHQDFRKILVPDTNKHERLDEINNMLFGNPNAGTKLPGFSELPVFEVDSAYQGQEGVELVKKALENKKPYAAVFVDVQMPPGEDGVETISRIWKIDPDIQTVICTAYANYSWQDLRIKFGETDRLFLLKKPFDTIEIMQMASSLTKKWNLNKNLANQQYISSSTTTTQTTPQDISPTALSNSQEAASTEGSLNKLKEAIDSLAKLNTKLKNKQEE